MHKPLLALATALLASSASADTLINVNGIQVGTDGKLQHFNGLLIGDDGRVIRVLGPADDFVPDAVGKVINGRSKTLLPGLIDAHGHVMGLGLGAVRLDLTGTTSLADLQVRLKDYAAANPQGWVIGRGWNQEHWPDKSFPTAADLDAVLADRPVALQRVDGHALVVNSAALRAAGIGRSTRDPVGGKIERDARGNASGLLIDNAMGLVEAKIPPPTTAQREQALAKAQELLLSSGLTAVADMGTSAEDWPVMHQAAQSGRLKFRIMSYAAGIEALDQISRISPTMWQFGDRLRMGGVKLYADGALGSRGAWLKRPYADKPDTRGLRFLSDSELRTQADYAAARGYQLAIHAIGDAANEQVISLFEELSRKWGPKRRWRIEHFQIADPADISRLTPAGIIASMQPIHQVSDRTMAEARLGPNRLGGAYAWQSVLKSGARLAFGSDFPVEPTNPFLGLSAAVSRQDPKGEPPGGWLPHERLTFAQALSGFTRDAAYAGYADSRIGSLEPGKWADFILIDRDPTKIDAQALARTQVLETWVAGQKVWEPAPSAAQPERGK